MPLTLAWKILLQHEVLFAGMKIEDAATILGDPTHVDAKRVDWVWVRQNRYATHLPAMDFRLSATTNEGIITSWETNAWPKN